ncbi:hypothetical protein Syun_006296 [Stephania yunnanensis]|uniref:NB-ARC domain-containing protein n=1 Tax=Stephania yunnanensis TaxID=152371 RepID=A0AAP0PYE4_9MAGN
MAEDILVASAHDHSVKEHCGLMTIWICVSEGFAITMVWSKFLKEIDSSIQAESLSKQEVQNHIKKQLNGKKFLLVLDDFWQKVRSWKVGGTNPSI